MNELIAGLPAGEWCEFSPRDAHQSGGPFELNRPIYVCVYCQQIVMRCWRDGSWNWSVPPIIEECP